MKNSLVIILSDHPYEHISDYALKISVLVFD